MEPYAWSKVITQLIVVPAALVFCWWRSSELLRIIALCISALILYGMLQDQVSVRLSREYFTLAHPPLEGITDRTLLGVLWGFLGSWWGGLFVGLSSGLTATLGREPQLTWRKLLGPVGVLLIVIACGTAISGLSGYYNGHMVGMRLGQPFAEGVPTEDHLAFFAVACGHFGSYSSAILGSIGLCIWIAWQRKKLATGALAQQQHRLDL